MAVSRTHRANRLGELRKSASDGPVATGPSLDLYSDNVKSGVAVNLP